MQSPKARNGSSDVPKRASPQATRQLRITGLELDSSSTSSPASRTPKDKSPKVVERRLRRSPVSEKKRPSRICQLESQVSQLQEELKKAKDQLTSSETLKKQAEQEAEDSKKQLQEVSLKLEESKKQFLELSASKKAQQYDSEFKAAEKQNSLDARAALASALQEIQQLKLQIEMVASSEAEQLKQAELANSDIYFLRENLVETLSLVENFKNQVRDCEVSEAETEASASETLLQLENAKTKVEALRSDGTRAIETFEKMALEFEQSKSCVVLLEELVSELQISPIHVGNHDILPKTEEKTKVEESNELEADLVSLRSEVERSRSALEASDIKSQEEKLEFPSQLLRKVARLESELKKAKSDIEELKANLIDKDTEFQYISEENESLHMKLEKNKKEIDRDNEIKKLKEVIEDSEANLMDKETELQNIIEENEMLKSEKQKKETDGQDAIVKLGLAMEEAEKSTKRAARVSEQLDAAQASNLEMETELRKLKVQSDQWRKAAEAAAAMLSAGNNGKFAENYSPAGGKMNSPYDEEMDDNLLNKKNGNVLKKIGFLWKKPQK